MCMTPIHGMLEHCVRVEILCPANASAAASRIGTGSGQRVSIVHASKRTLADDATNEHPFAEFDQF